MKLKKGTILIPCYNEEHNLPLLYSHLLQLMEDESGFCGSDGIILIGSCFESIAEPCGSERGRVLFGTMGNQPMFPFIPSSSKYQYRKYWNSLLLYGLCRLYQFCFG